MTNSTARLVAIIGHPIAQVKSPANFDRHFAERGEDRTMIPMDIAPTHLEHFISLFRGWNNLDGFVVTIPHKAAVASRVDELTPRAQFLEAVNVVRKDVSGRLYGDMVDGVGFLNALRHKGFSPEAKAVLLVGAGAAGSAIGYALAEAGIASLALIDIDKARAARLCERLSAAFPDASFSTDLNVEQAFDFVINASPMGMAPDDPVPVDQSVIEHMPENGLAADVITSPELTPFLKRAAARGLTIQTGAEMAEAQLLVLGRFMGVIAEEDLDA